MVKNRKLIFDKELDVRRSSSDENIATLNINLPAMYDKRRRKTRGYILTSLLVFVQNKRKFVLLFMAGIFQAAQ